MKLHCLPGLPHQEQSHQHMNPWGTFQPYSNFSNHKAALIFPPDVCTGKYPPRVHANREPQAPQALSLRAGILLRSLLYWLVGGWCTNGQPRRSLLPLFLPPGLFFLLGKPDALRFNYMLQLEVQNVSAEKEGPRYR